MLTRRHLIILAGILIACGFAAASNADEDAPAGYYSANGLLNRGLYDLAAPEYRQFLAENSGHEKAPVARYGLSVCLFRTQKYKQAADELRPLTSLEDFPFAVEAGVMLGQSYLALNQYDKAVHTLKDLVTKHKRHDLTDDAAAMLIEAYYRAEQYEAAVTLGRRFDARWPDNPLRERTLFHVGLSHLALADHEAAAESLAQLLKSHPNSLYADQAALMLAQCRHRLGALEAATRWYKKTLAGQAAALIPDALYGYALLLHQQGHLPRAGELLDRLLKMHPESKHARDAGMLRGRIWFEQNSYDKAAELFQQASGVDDVGEEAAYWSAKCRLRQDRPDDAANMLQSAMKKYPSGDWRAEMLYDLGVALTRIDREKDAARAFNAFLDDYAEHAMAPDALAMLAVIEHRGGSFESSVEHCDAFLRDHAAHEQAADVRFIRAENFILAREYEEALDAYREFLTRHGDDPQAPRAVYRLGMTLFHLNRHDEALEPLLASTKLVEADNAYMACELALGEIYFQRSDWGEAEEHLAAYLKNGLQAPAADDALLKLGLSRQRLQKQNEAREAYERLLEQFEDSPARLHAMFELGQTLVALGLPDEAEKRFEQVVEQAPDSRFAPFALNHLGAIASARRDHARAADYFAQVMAKDAEGAVAAEAQFQRGAALLEEQDYEAAGEAFNAYVKRWPDGELAPRARARHAITLARRDMPKKALKAIERVEKAHADLLDSPTMLALRHEKAWCLKKLNRPEEAAALYGELADDSSNPGLRAYAMLEQAEILAAKNDCAAAVALLRRLRELADAGQVTLEADVRAPALYRLGACLFEQGDSKAAADVLTEFLTNFTEHELTASASYFCGEALFKLGRHREAIDHLTRVVEDFEKNDARGPAMLRLGECRAALQHWAKSEEVFGDYLRLLPDSEHWYQARFGLGWARENQQRYDEAIADYRAVVERHKGATAARAQFQIGECLFAQKRLEEATRELLKVDILYTYPEWSAAALYEAGRCFEQQGKAVEARAQYKAVAEKYENTRWAAMAAQRLAAVTAEALPGRGRAD